MLALATSKGENYNFDEVKINCVVFNPKILRDSWLREAKTYFFYPTYGSRMTGKQVRLRIGTRMGSQNNTYFGCKNTVFLRKNQIK